MDPQPRAASTEAEAPFLPRRAEMEALARLLPLKGVEASSKRVIAVWGEREVGKSSFVSAFRESELMAKSKTLWIQPTRDGALDTVEEFIRACSKTIRYPAAPEKEEKIARKLESVQRGKINPIVSDDSLLITRSTLASNRKPYVNKAAASSVGRTEIPREEVDVSVGLGESKATNQAEGFLDALPLQALGTDLIILYLQHYDRLAVPVVDWLRDYVIPAATRGPYRRSLAILIESPDPLHLAYPNDDWGEWDNLRAHYRLHPLSEDDTYAFALRSGLLPEEARYVWFKSRGYPGAMNRCIAEAKAGSYARPLDGTLEQRLTSLDPEDRLRLAAASLIDVLYPDELDAVFGPGLGKESLKRLAASLPGCFAKVGDSQGFSLPDPLRLAALSQAQALPEFKELRRKASPLVRLIHNVPARSDRAKLLMLSGLNWIDAGFCRDLFGEKAERILAYIVDSPQIFNRRQERYRVSERLRSQLIQVATAMEHPGVTALREQAWSLWEQRQGSIESRIEQLESTLSKEQDAINRLIRRHSESAAQLRVQERKSEGEEAYSDYTREVLQRPNRGPVILLLLLSALGLFFSGYAIDFPYSLISLVLGLAALSVGLAYIPGWMARRRAIAVSIQAQTQDSPEYLRKQTLDLTHQIQNREAGLDDLKDELARAKELLRYPFAIRPDEQEEAETLDP